VSGLTRQYLLHVPDSYKAGAPMPLVFVLHGATQSPESAERMSEMSTLSDKYGCIAVYPRGTGPHADMEFWRLLRLRHGTEDRRRCVH